MVFDRSSEPNHILIDVSEQQSPGTVSLVKPSMTSTSSSSSQPHRRARHHTIDAEMVNEQMNPEIDGEVEMEKELETILKHYTRNHRETHKPNRSTHQLQK